MAKRFGELFLESWKEYKENFKFFILIMFLFIFIPSLFLYFFDIPWNADMMRLGNNPTFEATMSVISNHLTSFILSSIIGIIVFLVSIFCYASILYGVLNKKKLIDFKDSLFGGKKNFFRYVWFSIVVGVFLFGLSLLFIIPGVIFGVFWCFSIFIFMTKEKKVIGSLKESYNIVRGKWWGTFGYIILVLLIYCLIGLGFSLVSGIINIILNPLLLTIAMTGNYSSYYTSPIWYINDFVSLIFRFLSSVVTFPLFLLFMKNFYLDRKAGKK